MDGRPVTKRPEHPDGTKYEFNCCALPSVREKTIDGSKMKVCTSCGYDWTEAL